MTTPDPEVTVDADDDALSAEVTAEYAGLRLDVVCAKLFDQYSRARLQQWIGEGRVKVDGEVLTRSREPVAEGGVIELDAVPLPDHRVTPQEMPRWSTSDACASSVRATINRPLVSLSSRCTMPARGIALVWGK